MRYLDITDKYQGVQRDGAAYGYCGIDDRGGYFFSWRQTLQETLRSIEPCEIYPPRHWPIRAYREMRGFVRRAWASGYRPPQPNV